MHICLFFFNDTATTEIYTRKDTLSLHDALPISFLWGLGALGADGPGHVIDLLRSEEHTSELQSPFLISYAVFCLKKKTNTNFVGQSMRHRQTTMIVRVLHNQ